MKYWPKNYQNLYNMQLFQAQKLAKFKLRVFFKSKNIKIYIKFSFFNLKFRSHENFLNKNVKRYDMFKFFNPEFTSHHKFELKNSKLPTTGNFSNSKPTKIYITLQFLTQNLPSPIYLTFSWQQEKNSPQILHLSSAAIFTWRSSHDQKFRGSLSTLVEVVVA